MIGEKCFFLTSQLFGSDSRKYVRRPTDTRYNSRYQISTVKHGGSNVIILRSFSHDGVGLLVEIKSTMNAIMHRDILTQHMLPYAT